MSGEICIGIAYLALAGGGVRAVGGYGEPGRSLPYRPQLGNVPPSGIWNFGTCGVGFVDDFDSYSIGNLCEQSPWEPWVGGQAPCGTVSDQQAFSPPHSLRMVGEPPGPFGGRDDNVRRIRITGGIWTLSIMTYVPGRTSGDAWILVLMRYPGDPPGTGIETAFAVRLRGTEGQVLVHGTSVSTALFYDRWVEFRAEIDLRADRVEYSYDGRPFGATPYAGAIPERRIAARIAAVDLWAGDVGAPGGPTTGVYYDDVMLVGNPGCGGGCDPCDTNCDGTIDAFDIEPFIDVLVNPNPNPCSPCAGDADGSGTVDAFDIEPFIHCLVGP